MRSIYLLLALATAACGTSQATQNDGGTDSGGGCINATAGVSCSSSDTACSLGDACCNGFFMCQSGKWVKEYPGCACQVSTFTCGTLMCSSSQQYCKKQESGIDGGAPAYSCEGMPTSCSSNQTCACVGDAGACSPTGVESCDDSQGHVAIACMGQ
jgi:hypothetical protein